MNWLKKNILPALVIGFIIYCAGFFLDIQVLKANVDNKPSKETMVKAEKRIAALELHFKYIKDTLGDIKTAVKRIERRER